MNRFKEDQRLFQVLARAAIQVIQIHLQTLMMETDDDRA